VTQVRTREFYKLERIVTVKNNARICHLVKLDRKYVGSIREFLHREVDRQWMAQPLPFTHRRLCLAQVFRRDALERDQDVVVRAQLDVIACSGRAVEHDRSEVRSMRRAQILDQSLQSFLYYSFDHNLTTDNTDCWRITNCRPNLR